MTDRGDPIELTLVTVATQLTDVTAARKAAIDSADEYVGVVQQQDTWLRMDEHGGGLLLRKSSLGISAVVETVRQDRGPVGLERQILTPIPDPDHPPPPWDSMEPLVVVRRGREVWVVDNVRLYLDLVPGVGLFFRIEAVVDDTHPPDRCREAVRRLLRQINAPVDSLQTLSYGELALETSQPDPDAERSAEIERMKEKIARLQPMGPGGPKEPG